MNNTQLKEENRPWWGGRASNPVGGAMRSRVGSTPILFRHDFTCVGRAKRARPGEDDEDEVARAEGEVGDT